MALMADEPQPPLSPTRSQPDEDVERQQRRAFLVEREMRRTQSLVALRKSERATLTALRREEFSLARRACQDDRIERIERWEKKTQGSPFGADLWAEDDAVYQGNVARNAAAERARKRRERQRRERQVAAIRAGLVKRDELGELRSEKRRMVEEQHALNAVQGILDKKERMDFLDEMREEQRRELERQQMACSDYYTMPIKQSDEPAWYTAWGQGKSQRSRS
eukprot:TRINITY_DN40701_c0_g1_i1.p1 TRINITY_DN40701_c0_g1~~TRINITY_DN40701_c0_g1_i1.p1  ORF type:complete len:238 (+),score=60.15 TRINITY_DN40701_c0_g1_i1:51-716(+)